MMSEEELLKLRKDVDWCIKSLAKQSEQILNGRKIMYKEFDELKKRERVDELECECNSLFHEENCKYYQKANGDLKDDLF